MGEVIRCLRTRLDLVRLWQLYACILIDCDHLLFLLGFSATGTPLSSWHLSLLLLIGILCTDVSLGLLPHYWLRVETAQLLHVSLLKCSEYMHIHLNLHVATVFGRFWSFCRLSALLWSFAWSFWCHGCLSGKCFVVLTCMAWAFRAAARLIVLVNFDIVNLKRMFSRLVWQERWSSSLRCWHRLSL